MGAIRSYLLPVICSHIFLLLKPSLYTYRHYSDVIMSAMASQITGVSIVCQTVCPGANEKKTSKHRITGLCEGNSPVPSQRPVTRSFDVIFVLRLVEQTIETPVIWDAIALSLWRYCNAFGEIDKHRGWQQIRCSFLGNKLFFLFVCLFCCFIFYFFFIFFIFFFLGGGGTQRQCYLIPLLQTTFILH